MNPPDPAHALEQEIFLEALERLPGWERDSWLDGACGGDAALRGRIAALLAADAEESLLRPLPAPAICGSADDGATDRAFVPYSGSYAIQGEIARGGMGTVYRGVQSTLDRSVAVKVLHRDSGSADSKRRFQHEAEVLARLSHPNIVPIHDLVRENGEPVCYSMKLVEGRTLQAILNSLGAGESEALRDFPLDRLLLVLRKVCDAVAFAHSRGVLHRDLKPENIMVGEFGEVLVMDWGLAKILGRGEEKAGEVDPGPAGEEESFERTLEGSVMGTPRYMSPEQAMGRIDELDERSDLFSLGGTLYAILTLRPPVEGSSLQEVLDKVCSGDIAPPGSCTTAPRFQGKAAEQGAVLEARRFVPLPHLPGGKVPAALSAVTMKALALEKDRRYSGVAAFAADIEAYQNGYATSAEEAGAWTQLKLLMLRHKAVTASLAAILLLSAGFVVRLVASERKATRNAAIALTNEQRATEQAEQTRRALGLSQIEVADAALRGADLPAMSRALDSVPEDLRDQRWDYLSAKLHWTRREIRAPGFESAMAVRAVPDGSGRFVLANEGGEVGILDPRSGAVAHRIPIGHPGRMRLAVSPDGRLGAATSDEASTVTVFRIADGSIVSRHRSPGTRTGGIVFSPDGRRLAVLDGFVEKPRISLLDLDDGTVEWTYPGEFLGAAFAPGGDRLYLGSGRMRKLLVLDAKEGKLIRETRELVFSMAASPDGGRLAIGLFNGEAILVDAATGVEIRRARLYAGAIRRIAWPAGGHLLTLGEDGRLESGRTSVRLWETKTFTEKAAFLLEVRNLDRIDWVLDPSTGSLVTVERTAKLHHIPIDLEASRIESRGAEQGWSARFLSDTLLVARREYDLRLYDVSDPRTPAMLPHPLPDGYVMTASHPSGLLALGRRITGPPYGVKLHRFEGQRLADPLEIPLPGWTMNLGFDRGGGRLLAVVRYGLGLFVIETATGKQILNCGGNFTDAVFAGAAEDIAAIQSKRSAEDMETELSLRDAVSGELKKSVVLPSLLNDIAASPDGSLVAVGGTDRVVRLFDAATLEERHAFRAHDDEITALVFHPSLPVVASASNDGSIKLWDYQTARPRRTFLGFDGTTVMLDFSPNGRLLVAESQDQATRIFDLGERFGR